MPAAAAPLPQVAPPPGPGFVRRILASPPLLQGASAKACGKAATAVSFAAGLLAAALLAALMSPPVLPQWGLDAAALAVLSCYGICLRLALILQLLSFFCTLGVGAIAGGQKPSDAAAACLLSLSLWAMLAGIWLAAAAASAAVWSAAPLRDIAATVTGGVVAGIALSLAMFLCVLSVRARGRKQRKA